MLRSFFLLAIVSLSLHDAMAQDIAAIPHKNKMLKGQWQLVRTYTQGNLHEVEKHEYDAVITFKSCHKYLEEVKYEGYHWIIKGKWKTSRSKTTLDIIKREYVSGSQGDKPEDIHFTLYQLEKNKWGADTRTKIEEVKMEYERLPAKK